MKKITILSFVIVCTLSACKNDTNETELTAREWQLVDMYTENTHAVLPQRVPTVMFGDSNRMSGFSGCNRFMGRYEAKGNNISIQPGATTMMACPDMAFEGKFNQVLLAVKTYSATQQEMQLKSKDGKQVLTFVPKTTTDDATVFAPDTQAKDSTTVTYQGGDGKTRMMYHMKVIYYSGSNRATVFYNEQALFVTQEEVKEGILYKNDNITLKGEIDNLTVTLSDDKVLTMRKVDE